MRPLGDVQKEVLRCLREHGGWPGRGWLWDTTSNTERICESLVRRGLVKKTVSHTGYNGKPVYFYEAKSVRSK